jgi:chain length determinant protein EpsF
MNYRQILLVLRARWLVAFAILLGAVLLALAFSLYSAKQYTAAASVVIDAKNDPVAGMMYPTQLLSSAVATQVDIIASERVARLVVKALKLDQVPDIREIWQERTEGRGDITAWIAENMLQKRLLVTPSRESNVISISVKWPDAKFAAVLANAFAQAYIDTNIELKVDPAKQYASWFDERSRALRLDLETKQKRLADFQAATGIVASDGRLDIENARLGELSSQLVTMQALRQDSQSRQRQANGNYESLPEVLQSPVVGSLKSDLSRAEARLKDIATNLGRNHPDYQTTVAEIAGLRDRIDQESDKIAASLGNTTQVNVRRENDIRAALEAQKKRMQELTHQRDEATVLQNDVIAAQRNLDAVSQRLAQSSLESQTQQTNIVLLTPAVEPVKPSSPRLMFNLAVGFFLGAVLGIGTALLLELMGRRVREDAELLQLLGVPLLGKIPDVRSAARSIRALPRARAEPSAI